MTGSYLNTKTLRMNLRSAVWLIFCLFIFLPLGGKGESFIPVLPCLAANDEEQIGPCCGCREFQCAHEGIVENSPPRSTRNEVRVVVEIYALRLTIWINGQPQREFPVAIGKRETPSPVGDWMIMNKGIWNKTRWLGLSVPFGSYGIHGTNQPQSIGTLASHGCIRMNNRDIEEVYRLVPVGAFVHIWGNPFYGRRQLKKGVVGADVMFIQKRLRQLGFFPYIPNGIYSSRTEKAVREWQKHNRIPETGEINWQELWRMRIFPEE